MLWMGRWFALRHDLRVALGDDLRLEQRHELAGKEQASSVCVGFLKTLPRGSQRYFRNVPKKPACGR